MQAILLLAQWGLGVLVFCFLQVVHMLLHCSPEMIFRLSKDGNAVTVTMLVNVACAQLGQCV